MHQHILDWMIEQAQSGELVPLRGFSRANPLTRIIVWSETGHCLHFVQQMVLVWSNKMNFAAVSLFASQSSLTVTEVNHKALQPNHETNEVNLLLILASMSRGQLHGHFSSFVMPE